MSSNYNEGISGQYIRMCHETDASRHVPAYSSVNFEGSTELGQKLVFTEELEKFREPFILIQPIDNEILGRVSR